MIRLGAALLLAALVGNSQANDTAWARDEAACDKEATAYVKRSCLHLATEKRSSLIFAARRRGEDRRFDAEIAACAELEPFLFRECYRSAEASRYERQAEIGKVKAAAAKAKGVQAAKVRDERHRQSQTQRIAIAAEYERVLKANFPALNYIRVVAAPHGDGFALYGQHSYFGRYTFDVGPAGPAIERWISDRAAELKRAEINRVGVRDGANSAVWFSL